MRNCLVTAAAALFLAGLSLPASAQPFETPEQLLEALYAPFLAGDYVADYDPFFSEGLTELYAIDAEQSAGEVGAIGFDPVIAGQDWVLTDFALGEINADSETAVAEVLFKNFDEPIRLVYSLVNEKKDGWQVDDIESTDGDITWDLRQLFEDAGY